MSGNILEDQQPDRVCPTKLTETDLDILADVERAVSQGRALKQWWEWTEAAGGYAERFELVREPDPQENSFGFFDSVNLDGSPLAVMGTVDDLLYDQPKTEPNERLCEEFREFILRYFMRVSSYRRPAAFVAPGQTLHGDVRPLLQPLSWCPESAQSQVGFGYSQCYYKLQGPGLVGKFSRRDEYAIVDLREIGRKYEWVVVKVRIFDFNMTFSPFGSDNMTLLFPRDEEIYLVISRDFITDENKPAPGLMGRYGFGYAFLNYREDRNMIARSQGVFGTGFQLINFSLDEEGRARVRLVLVVNRPDNIVSVDIDPVGWGFRLADIFSFGMLTRFLSPARDLVGRFAPKVTGFDPLAAYLSFARVVSGGLTTERLCMTRETLDKEILVQH
ncbi:MAG: hypothetical protein LC802_22735, partial [Acidobacteria bacterium]|nr:hypothetical protein [Acidobacteriota bacterium]